MRVNKLSDKNNDSVIVNKELREVVYLKVNGKPLGRFCELPGCTNRLKGKKVKRKNPRNGSIITLELPVLRTQRFCCKYHKTKAYDLRKNRTKTTNSKALDCRIRLNVQQDKQGPYREVYIYLVKGSKLTQKIRPDNKELWEVLEKIYHYRSTKPNERIKPMNLLSLVNIVK